MQSDGWLYLDGGTFRKRFPVWLRIHDSEDWQLMVECEDLVEGRWEPFISFPQIFWSPDVGVQVYQP